MQDVILNCKLSGQLARERSGEVAWGLAMGFPEKRPAMPCYKHHTDYAILGLWDGTGSCFQCKSLWQYLIAGMYDVEQGLQRFPTYPPLH